MPNPTETDKLIYQNSHQYRIHTDTLRWTLLGGYAAILAAIVGLSQSQNTAFDFTNPLISFLAFVFSVLYLMVLAVQNWFYNLYARYADECEYRIIQKLRLRSLQSFASDIGEEISPFHPAFFFVEAIVGLSSFTFLSISIIYANIPVVTQLLKSLRPPVLNVLWIFLGLSYFITLNYIFVKWDKFIYKPIIKRLSNLYKPVKNK